MLSKRIIPCLDVNAGRVVKGIKFKELRDAGDPVSIAKAYQDQGADELVFLDITASSDAREIIHHVVEQTASECFMPLTVGGGLRNVKNIRDMLNAGADKVSLNTAAINNPNLIDEAASHFGNQCIVLAIDAKKNLETGRWDVYTHGGRNKTNLDAIDWAVNAVRRGVGEILLTSMDNDGVQDGYDLDLTRTLSDAVEVPVIASGGAGEISHMVDAVKQGHASAVLAASIFHFGKFTISEVKQEMSASGVQVRI